MVRTLSRYVHWLHTQWPAGTVENLPLCDEEGRTNVPGVRIAGDLTGIPLLKFSSASGAAAVRNILHERNFVRGSGNGVLDLAIIGGGIAGISAAIEAKKAGLHFEVFEGAHVFATLLNFPKGKPIYTYPTEMVVEGGLSLEADIKESLVAEVEEQRRLAGVEVTAQHIEFVERRGHLLIVHGKNGFRREALRVIVAIGRSGNHRRLGVPGEDLPNVYNRLHDPMEFAGKSALVVGGGDSALETAIALTGCGARVLLSYRQAQFARAKPVNIEKLHALIQNPRAEIEIERPASEQVTTAMTAAMRAATPHGSLDVLLGSQVERITLDAVQVRTADGALRTIPNDIVFTMVGREAPLDFLRRSHLKLREQWSPLRWLSFAAFFAFCCFVYLWKGPTTLNAAFARHNWFPFNVQPALQSLSANATVPATLLGTIAISMKEPGFYYSLAYTALVVGFGARRIRRNPTPYIKAQTLTLIALQVLPLFLLPYVLLPWAGHNGWFAHGAGRTFADALFPVADYGHGREYWRSFGFILAWPLFIWNVFSNEPLWTWLILSFLQTFVAIPLIVWRWGKGAYCGWICSCGALAETLGDAHRHKMPHGPRWNRLNVAGQMILALALLLLVLRILGWIGIPFAEAVYGGLLSGWALFGLPLNYYRLVDIFLAGIVGVGAYFWFSGRVWCRFFCPLAALMHIYARFSRYRIFAEKKKCISCNVCTAVCHQGIDVMNFANKGLPLEDPQCVRCSACVTQCPTGVLTFGRFGPAGEVILDKLPASPVQMREADKPPASA